ncbi:MAG: glycosyltransferase family 8 protein [Alphaproteobacteria bacterium]|nr:glycosyltransferase family 8 protein [Alphaproteobacteria bacterium]
MREKHSTSILICFDNAYAPAASVMLTSLFLNNGHLDIDLYAITAGLSSDSLEALDHLCQSFQRRIEFIEIDRQEYDHLKASDHFSQATYFRVFGPDKIAADRILYHDVDLIVQADLAPLLDCDLDGKLFAAALDNNVKPDRRDALALVAGEPYVNAGVLLIDAVRWRHENVAARLVDYYRRNESKIRWADQDMINGCLQGDKLVLDQKWNVLYGDLINDRMRLPDFDTDSFRGIFHFNTVEKPWFQWARYPYRTLYEKYAAVAPIRMTEVTESGFRARKRRIRRFKRRARRRST